MRKPHKCPVCEGEGKKHGGAETCPSCKGKGMVWEPSDAQESAVTPVDSPLDLTYREA